MSPSSCCFSFETSFTTSPLSTAPLNSVELLHLGSSRVEDTTYLGRLFSRSAHSPFRDSHRAANHSSVRRPSSRALAPSASSSSSLVHSSRAFSPISKNQPPCLKPSSPVGSWTTPSSETFSLMMIFPMSVSFGWRDQLPLVQAPRRRETGRPPAAQFAPRPVSLLDRKATGRGKKGDPKVVAADRNERHHSKGRRHSCRQPSRSAGPGYLRPHLAPASHVREMHGSD